MSSQSVSEGTFFQAKRLSHCLSSFSVLGAGSPYFVSSKIIQMVSRGVTLREFAGRSFCYKASKSFWHYVCMCAAFFSSGLSSLF